MLKNSKIGYNWIFHIIIGYYNWIFLVSSLPCVFFCLFLLFCSCFFLFGFLELEAPEGLFFQKVHLYIWAVAGRGLSNLSIQAQSLNS